MMKAWFGELDGYNVMRAGRSIEDLAKRAEASDSVDVSKEVNLEGLAIESGLCPSSEEYRRLLHDTAMRVANNRIAESLAGKDAYLIQAVRALDDLNDAFNIITERLAEWYGIHYPEQHVRTGELLDFILQKGTRDAPSIGAPLSQEDLGAVQGLALTAKALFSQRKSLEGYVKTTMEALAPNLSNVLGPTLGARLIARAGSLEKLAMMPGSRVQVMGAGEALFKHLKIGTPSPKHGLIYKHPLIIGAPKKSRGRIARMLAGKAAIAARMDFYSGEIMDFGNLKEKAEAIKAKGKKKP